MLINVPPGALADFTGRARDLAVADYKAHELAKLTVPVTFTSSDGNSISGFAINNSLGGSLPPGWSGPQTFNCATLST